MVGPGNCREVRALQWCTASERHRNIGKEQDYWIGTWFRHQHVLGSVLLVGYMLRAYRRDWIHSDGCQGGGLLVLCSIENTIPKSRMGFGL